MQKYKTITIFVVSETIFYGFKKLLPLRRIMRSVLHKISAFLVCAAYVLTLCGFSVHTCNMRGTSRIAIGGKNICNNCCKHKAKVKKSCCKHKKQFALNFNINKNCCKTTVEFFNADQNISQNIFSFDINSVVANFFVFDLNKNACNFIAQNIEEQNVAPPPLNLKIPLIYKNGILRL